MKKAFHPGKVLRERIENMDMSAAEIARCIHVPANRISQIMAEKRNVSADTALRLGKFFGTGPEFWLNLQSAHELDLALQDCGIELQSIVPLEEMSQAWTETDENSSPARSNWGHVPG